MRTTHLDALAADLNAQAYRKDARADGRGRFAALVAYLRDDPDGIVAKHLGPLAKWALGALLSLLIRKV